MMNNNMENLFKIAMRKTQNNMQKIGSDLREFPGNCTGEYFPEDRSQLIKLEHVFGWTQSFFTGAVFWAYQNDKKDEYLKWLNSFYSEYYDKVFKTPMDTMHDLGFVYTPYAVALYKQTGDINMKNIAIKAADELAKRFVPNGGYIQAWGRMDEKVPPYISEQLSKDNFFANSKGLAIIDCMMNIPLLFWASETTGNPFYKRIAIAHADTTLKYFVREDNSVCHAYRFDVDTGEAVSEFNDCGYSVGSHWARGTAWAVYGFAIAYRYTKKQEYYDAAIKLAEKFIPLCETDGIPIWDFRLPKEIPARYSGREREFTDWDITDKTNTIYNRDTSAAIILNCGLVELLEYQQNETFTKYIELSMKTISEKFIDNNPDKPGLMFGQNGNNTFSPYGDYFLIELLGRLLYKFKSIW